MSFIAVGVTLGTGAAVTAGTVAAGASLLATGVGVAEASKARKAASANGGQGENYKPLDVDKVITDARTSAAENYKNSIALEAQYNPGQAALRTLSNTAQANLFTGNTPGLEARNSMLSHLGDANPLLNESADSILAQLRLGGSLPADTQAAIARHALATGGQAGLSGSFAGRGLVARDLGLTSLQLIQQRQAAAQNAGSLMEQLKLARYNAAMGAAGQDIQTTGLLGNLINGQPLPESGLSSGSIASLYAANNNANNQNASNQAAIASQARNQQINGLLGFGTAAAPFVSKLFTSGGGAGAGGSVDLAATGAAMLGGAF